MRRITGVREGSGCQVCGNAADKRNVSRKRDYSCHEELQVSDDGGKGKGVKKCMERQDKMKNTEPKKEKKQERKRI